MKSCILLLICLAGKPLLGQTTNSREIIPAYGEISKAELQMSSCDFDKEAEAFALSDVEELHCREYAYSVNTDIYRHVRIKILKDKGLEEANVKIPYLSYKGDEKITDINAQTFNLDPSGNIVVTKLDKKSIFDKPLNKRVSQKIFSFPQVKVGSVIEYSYKESSSVATGLRDWHFQKAIPVKISRYTVDFPEDIEIRSEAYCTLPVEKSSQDAPTRTVREFTMKNIPALRDEPFITCETDYLQRVESKVIALVFPGRRINMTSSWYAIVHSLIHDEDFGVQLNEPIKRTEDLESAIRDIKDSLRKMLTIYEYVKKNMAWNDYTSIWALKGVNAAWKEKKGTSGEINIILINLLRGAGIKANPVLASTHEHGRINPIDPGTWQFDKVMAFVHIHDKSYVLDATDKNSSPRLIPLDVMYTQGLLILTTDSLQWGWIPLWDDKIGYNTLININAVINDEGVMQGDANIYSSEYARTERLSALKDGKEKFIEKYFASPNPGIHIDSVDITNEENDTLPLMQKISFSQKLNSSGVYKFFSTNLFTGLEKNPFVAQNRFCDIFFGANQKYTFSESFFIPDGYGFDELPKNTRMMLPDTSIIFTRIIQTEQDHLTMRVTLEFKKPIYMADDYGNFREFYKKLFAMLNEQIVIKKKV